MSETLTKQPNKNSPGATGVRRKSSQASFKKAGSGVVSNCVHGATGKTKAATLDPTRLIEVLRVGLPVQELMDLQATLRVPMEKLVPKLGISKATLHRRKATGRLDPAESDRVVRFARLMGKAVEVLESEDHAREWLTSPQFGLGGAVPLDYADTEVGAREVEDLLGRIEYGIYS